MVESVKKVCYTFFRNFIGCVIMKSGFHLKNMVGIALLCVLMTMTAWLTVPAPIPFTLQTLGLFLAVGLLGTKSGVLSVIIYLILGVVGLPVFAAMKGGIGVLLGPTGGFLLGFLPASLICGWLLKQSLHPVRMGFSFFVGLLVVYTVGILWYWLLYASQGQGIWAIFSLCVFPFILPDLIKILLAVLLVKRVAPFLRKMGWERW
jgi:biotin transport system substrate-specific component